MGLTTKVMLNKVRQKSNGTFPLVLRVTYNTKVIYFPLGHTLSEKDWNEKNQEVKPSSKITSNVTRLNNQIRTNVSAIYHQLVSLQESGELDQLGLKEAKAKITGKTNPKNDDVFAFLSSEIDALREARKTGNASVYKNLEGKLRNFHGSRSLPFMKVDYAFLKRLEVDHLANGGEEGGLSVYMRTLRAAFNKAINSGIISTEIYPFSRYKIKNPKKKTPKALNEENFSMFRSIDLAEFPHLERTRDLYMASFYMRGMNWMDMAYLTVANITGGEGEERITYIRRKTKQPFNMKVVEPLKLIFQKYINFEQGQNEVFLLPILQGVEDSSKYEMTIRNKRLRANKYLKAIAEKAEIPTFSIYSARHTYATFGKRKGVPTIVIQQQMGHATETMTQTYLDSFENTVLDEYDKIILK